MGEAMGRVNTAGFPEEFRSRENLGDLRGMHLRRYVGNVTSRRRHRICTTMAARRFRFAGGSRRRANTALPSETRARAGLSDVPGLSDLNDLARVLRPAKSKLAARSGFPFYPRIMRARRLAR